MRQKKEKRKKDEVQQRNPETKKMKKQSTPVLANWKPWKFPY